MPFVVRLRQGTWVREGRRRFRLHGDLLRPGQVKVWRQVCLREDGRVRLNLVAHRAPNAGTVLLPQEGGRMYIWRWNRAQARGKRTPKEPWFLATSLENLDHAVLIYALRMGIEESFRDSKGGFGAFTGLG